MPWCEECAKYWTPNAMNDDGTCPRCGAAIDEGDARTQDGDGSREDERTPWHFKLLVVALVLYLGWRFVQLVT